MVCCCGHYCAMVTTLFDGREDLFDFSRPKAPNDALLILSITTAIFGGFVCVAHWCFAGIFPVYTTFTLQKQIYMAKNFTKSIFLAALTIPAVSILVLYFSHNFFDVNMVRIFGSFYAGCDIGGLLMMSRSLKFTTLLHHGVVFVVGYMNLTTTFSTHPVWKGWIIYTIFSSFAFLVNYTLAVRFVVIERSSKTLARVSLVIYSVCCFFNWMWQINIWFRQTEVSQELLVMVGLMVFIIIDDLVLMQWLFSKSRLNVKANKLSH